MKHEILPIGIQNLPRPIDSLTWEYALKEQVNITDYDIVFIDFSSFPYIKKYGLKLSRIFNISKIIDTLKGGTKLFILIDDKAKSVLPIFTGINMENIFSYYFGFVMKITIERGKSKKVLKKEFQDYYKLLRDWTFCFSIYNKSMSELCKNGNIEYIDCDIVPIAENKARKFLGVLLTNFKLIECTYRSYHYLNLNNSNPYQSRVKEHFSGKLYILHTLGNDSNKGVLTILKNLFGLSFTREEPEWSKKIEFEKSKEIKKKVQELEEKKSKLIQEINRNKQELQRLNEFKKLLWETGHELEGIVHKCFKELLFVDISVPTKSEEDGIFEYDSSIFVVEIKSGERRGAKFEELSKLITRMQNIRVKCKKDVKGIFIINHYANFPPNERKNPFPDNVKKTAEVNNVKLLTTVELFEIIKNVIDGKLDKKEAINKILE